MLVKMPFQVVDVDVADSRGWARALTPHRPTALRLLTAFEEQCLAQVTQARGRAGRHAFGVLRRLLSRLVAARLAMVMPP